MKWTIAVLGLFGFTVLIAAKPGQTPDPAVRGITLIGPAPDYKCSGNGAFPHEIYCDLFYDCYNDLAYLMGCTDDTLFDLTFHGCGPLASVDCGDRILPNGTTSVPGTTTTRITTTKPTRPPGTPIPGAPECTPDHHGAYYPHEFYCEQYFQCDNYDAILFYCKNDFLFDLVYMGCNYPEQVDCGDRERPPGATGTTKTTTRTTTTDGPGFECKENGAFPHPIYCEKYYDCYNEVATLMKCNSDWLFEPKWQGCEKPEDVDCGDRIRPTGPPQVTTTTRPTTSTTTKEPGTNDPVPTSTTTRPPVTGDPEFSCPQPDGDFADPKDCSGFYTCSNGLPFKNTCPRPLFFDDVAKICNFPDNVSCGTRPIPTFF